MTDTQWSVLFLVLLTAWAATTIATAIAISYLRRELEARTEWLSAMLAATTVYPQTPQVEKKEP